MSTASGFDWLKSMQGFVTSGSALVSLVLALLSTMTGTLSAFAKNLGIAEQNAEWAARGVSWFLLVAIVWFGVRSYRRFSKASRIERPERFRLAATTPVTLIGRDEELERLKESVEKNRVVLLDGESGCGKSALVTAGLVPRLQSGVGLLPILVREWGDDWVRGPLASALHALFEGLAPEERNKLGWTQAPDLAADAESLIAEVRNRIKRVSEGLGRRTLLIADQFDDYQAQHLERFRDTSGNWVKPDALVAANPFWELVSEQLMAGALHMLAVTRSDTASGLSCLRFLEASKTVVRRVPRVDLAHLRPLLHSIAPDGESPAVVSHPDQGWHELRERLEVDLRSQTAILMQQVRTIALGLRQLPMLTIAAYRRGGELRGMESLAIARALTRAGDAAGGSETSQCAARRLLGALVLPGGTERPPKAKRVAFSTLSKLAGVGGTGEKMLRSLKEDDVVRPAEAVGIEPAWQLDHDYLAGAVLAEARQADRWGVALREGLEHSRRAAGNWRQGWAALLPTTIQVRVAWERAHGRLRYGEAADYARQSLLKPGLALLLAGTLTLGAFASYQEWRLRTQAQYISDGFGDPKSEANRVLVAWRAPAPVRNRLFQSINESSSRRARATRSAWPHAHGGLQNDRLAESAVMLRDELVIETDASIASSLARAYARVVAKVTDPTILQQEAGALRALFMGETDSTIAAGLAQGYAIVVAKNTDPTVHQQAVSSLRERLMGENNSTNAARLAMAYVTVVAKITDLTFLQQETTALREGLIGEADGRNGEWLAKAYVTVVAKITDLAFLQQETTALREGLMGEAGGRNAMWLARAYATAVANADPTFLLQEANALRALFMGETSLFATQSLAQAYARLVANVTDSTVQQQAASALRQRLIGETYSGAVATLTWDYIAEAYLIVIAEVTDPTVLQQEVSALGARFRSETDARSAENLAFVYDVVVAKVNDPTFLQQEASALRERLTGENNSTNAARLAKAYAIVVAKVTDPAVKEQAASALRQRLMGETDSYAVASLSQAYAIVVAKITDPAVKQQAASALRERFMGETNSSMAAMLARAYAIVVAKVTDPIVQRQAASALLQRLMGETDSYAAASLSQAYAIVVANATDPTVQQQAASALRQRLMGETDSALASRLAGAYAAVVANVTDATVQQQAASALRQRLMGETDSGAAARLAEAYATVVWRILEVKLQRDKAEAAPHVRELLTLLGHPFLTENTNLLAALESVAGQSFDANVGAAVEWWVKEFNGDPANLRPPAASR